MSIIKLENISKTDFDHICRTCSAEGDLKPLFENIETLSMLESFTQMQFSKTDELPDKICTNCLTKINDCFQFINNCKILDENFRKCLNEPEINTDELHSSIEIKDDDEVVEKTEDVCVDEEKSQEINDNVKEINVKQSEYYILQWGAPSRSPENKLFQVSVINNPSNEQDLIEKEAARRIQEAEHIRKFRKIEGIRRLNSPEESHRTRAKLTLPPHEEQSVILRRNHETPEKIALRRALAREQFRRYRCKLTADEKADHRTQAAESLRKIRQKLNQNQELEETRAEARELIRSFQEPKDVQKPLRLAEMAQTMLRPDPLDNKMTRFSLRPTKIPQVKKLRFEEKAWAEPQILKFRSWTRETPKETAIRKAAAIQMNKYYASLKEASLKEPCLMPRISSSMNESESALRRAKAAGHLRQYRPVLRKTKGVPEANGQN